MAPKRQKRAQGEEPAAPPAPPLSLRCIGFCGVDDSVEPLLLRAISLAHPSVEWGILFRPDLAGTPRYASDAWLNSLASLNGAAPQAHAGHAPPGGGGAPCATRDAAPKQNTPSPAPKRNAPAPAPEEDSPAPARPLRLAGHLCSSRVDEILAGDSAFVAAAAERLGIDRFQINATATNGVDVSVFADDAGADRCAASIRSICASCPSIEFILQCNTHTAPLWRRIVGARGGDCTDGGGSRGRGEGGGAAGGSGDAQDKKDSWEGGSGHCARDGRGGASAFRGNGERRAAARARQAGGTTGAHTQKPPPNLSLLYDESMGLGVACSAWGEPHAGVPCGYAGGLSPENIKEQLSAISSVAPGRCVWVDMESSLRVKTADGRDIFDVNRAVACLRHVKDMGLL